MREGISCFRAATWRPMSSWHVPQPGEPCVAPSDRVQGHRRSATVTETPLGSEGSSCSAPPSAGFSSSVNTRCTPMVARYMCGKPASEGTLWVLAQQLSHFSTATLTRADDLRQLVKRAVRERQHLACSGAMRRPGSSVRAHTCYNVRGTPICDDLPEICLVVDDLRSGSPTCCFSSGGFLGHTRQQGLQFLGRPVSPPPAVPAPDVLLAWGVALGDEDAESILAPAGGAQ